MAIQNINLGTYANDGTGDDLRAAFTKVNDNFDYIDTFAVISGTNLGAGAPVFKTANGGALQFRTIAAGTNLTVSYDGNVITVAANNPFVGNVTGDVSGNASTVTNGVYTTSSINALADVDTSTTPPTNGQSLVWNSGTSQWKPGTVSGGGGLTDIVNDTTPQLGGALDVNGFSIVSTGNGDINIDPAGNGDIILHTSLTINPNGNITKTGELNISPTTTTSFGNNTTLVDGNVYIVRNSYSSAFGSGLTFAQHHATADAVNLNFLRTRGTGLAIAAVANGDDIADLNFIGHDGTNRVSIGSITARVSGAVSLGIVPGELAFDTRNTAGVLSEKAVLTSQGVWRVNSIQALSESTMSVLSNINIGNNFSLSVGGMTLSQDGLITSTSSNQSITIRSNGIGNVAIEGISITSRQIATDGNFALQLMSVLQLPSYASEATANSAVGASPVSGMMYYDSTANSIKIYGPSSWQIPGAGSGLSSRASVAGTSASLASNASGNIDITGFKGYMLYKIQTSVASWVRLYTDSTSRTADASRLEGVDPAPGAGVIAEVITTGASTILISPGAFGFNNEGTPTTNIPVRVTNKSGSTSTVTVTLVVVQLEA
jgi:hypothetical protein